jgi:hypothetical protein
MERCRLSIRVDAENPRHHLWNNHGTWWIHYTVHTPQDRIRRVRRSLGTGELGEARRRRDEVLERLRWRGEQGVGSSKASGHANRRKASSGRDDRSTALSTREAAA